MSEVRQFVGDAHGDLDAVRAALGTDPTPANASWDWGDGDWETALGAAAHMGRRDIAELPARHPLRSHAEAGNAERVLQLLAG